MDGRDAWEEGQYGAVLETGLGLEGLDIPAPLNVNAPFFTLSLLSSLYHNRLVRAGIPKISHLHPLGYLPLGIHSSRLHKYLSQRDFFTWDKGTVGMGLGSGIRLRGRLSWGIFML